MDSSPSQLSSEQLLGRAKAYDKVDAVFLLGDEDDLHLDPWDIAFVQLHSLIKMCLRTEMPLFASGFAAIIYAYIVTAQSELSCVLNSKDEESFPHRLENLPYYAEGHQGVWIRRDTGDVYAYDASSMSWSPIGNLGITVRSSHRFEHDR